MSSILRDLDFQRSFPNGFTLNKPIYKLIVGSIRKDAMLLNAIGTTDYSLLIGYRYLEVGEPVESIEEYVGTEWQTLLVSNLLLL